ASTSASRSSSPWPPTPMSDACERGRALADNGITGEHIVAPTAASDDVLRVEHIRKRFGPSIALRDINMHLRKGEVLGLLGDNGAGKSTLIKTICGFQKPDSGQMFLDGQPYAPHSVDHARKLGI